MRRITRSMTKDASGGSDTAASTSTPHAVEDNLNSSSSSSGSQMKTASANTTQVNPLLTEDFLEKLFPYLNDRKTLTSVRLVNKTWNHTSASALKKALTWRVGPYKNSEQRFLKTMSKLSHEERCRTFRNFTLKHKRVHLPKGSGCTGLHVDKFMEKFGPHMINLKIKSMDINYVRAHLKQTFLANLEQLEFYDMSQEVLADPALLENADLFTKVNSLSFNALTRGYEQFSEGEGRICFNMLKACPNLRQLEIDLRRTTLKILRDVNSELNLASLTSFKNSLRCNDHGFADSTVILQPLDFYALVRKCPNLKILSVNISQVPSKTEICQMLSNYSSQLEELYISILDDDEDSDSDFSDGADRKRHSDWESSTDDESEEEEVGARNRKIRKIDNGKSKLKKVKKHEFPFPDFPLLKKLVIISWFYNDLDKLGSMPLLQEIDIKMKEGVALQLGSTPTDSYPSVRSLKFRCAFGRYWSLAAFVNNEDYLKASMVAPLISIFPNVTELDVELKDDEALRNLFSAFAVRCGGQIKRLHLNNSGISDSGLTGIPWTEQLKMAHNLSMDTLVENYRRYPFIGLLTGLQELTYKRNELTNLSVEFGLVSLKELTSLKLPPHKAHEGHKRKSYVNFSSNSNQVDEAKSLVNVRVLVDNLKYLVKLDVNDDYDREKEEWEKRRCGGQESGPEADDKFKGCGISVDDLGYIKEHAPNLEIVYGEIKMTP